MSKSHLCTLLKVRGTSIQVARQTLLGVGVLLLCAFMGLISAIPANAENTLRYICMSSTNLLKVTHPLKEAELSALQPIHLICHLWSEPFVHHGNSVGSAVFWSLASGSVITKAEKAHSSRGFNCEGLWGWGNVPRCDF